MGFFERNRQSLLEKGYSPDRLPPGQYYTERYPVLHVGDVPQIAPTQWNMRVFGLVANERTFTWDDLHQMDIVTLTTDIGHKGPFVATMKGVILTRFPAARIVDLTHEIDVHFPAEAGFWLARSFRYFPRGTTHVAVVDPGVGTGRDVIAVVHDGHAFLAPDNGLLATIAERAGARVFKVDLSRPARFNLGTISATFHGRDVFAPLVDRRHPEVGELVVPCMQARIARRDRIRRIAPRVVIRRERLQFRLAGRRVAAAAPALSFSLPVRPCAGPGRLGTAHCAARR